MNEDQLIALYREKHTRDVHYGSGGTYLKQTKNLCTKFGCTDHLDYGCGKGNLVDFMAGEGLSSYGWDPAVPGRSEERPVLAREYDCVTCHDVAEHWLPRRVRWHLGRIRRLTRKFAVFAISCRPAVHKLPDGSNCHTTVKPPEWWEAELARAFEGWTMERLAWSEGNRCLVVMMVNPVRPRHIENLEIFSPQTFFSIDRGEIAIVGNGPVSPSCRERIDSAGVVVRFNDWNLRATYRTESHGDRCDSLSTHYDSNPKGPPPKSVVIAIPSPFHQDRIIDQTDAWYLGSRLFMINPYQMRIICRDVLHFESEGWKHPMPTVGFTFLYLLSLVRQKGHNYFITGFDWHVDREKGEVNRVNVQSDVVPSHFNHSYLRESKWCATNLLRRPEFEFSDPARAALEYVEWAAVHQEFESNYHRGGGGWRFEGPGCRWDEAREFLARFVDFDSEKGAVLDVGSGPRSMGEFFASRSHLSVIEPLTKEFKRSLLDRADEQYPFPAEKFIEPLAGRFDFVWTHNVLDHCYCWRTVVENIAKYLKAGGRFYIGTDAGQAPHTGHPGIESKEALVDHVEGCGLEIDYRYDKNRHDPEWPDGPWIRSITLTGRKR